MAVSLEVVPRFATTKAGRRVALSWRSQAMAIACGIYDVANNTGWVNVGTDHDTAPFAVESIRRWWQHRGRTEHPNAGRLLITADSGGSNDPRRWTWKTNLATFARESGLEITVCHLPPGTSKGNKKNIGCSATSPRTGGGDR